MLTSVLIKSNIGTMHWDEKYNFIVYENENDGSIIEEEFFESIRMH